MGPPAAQCRVGHQLASGILGAACPMLLLAVSSEAAVAIEDAQATRLVGAAP
jgi:hypothetical protein